MLYTLGQAAKAVGKAKGTIKNAIDKGRLSASKNDIGQYQIDPAELHRVYPLPTEQSNLNAVEPHIAPPFSSSNITALEDRVKLLENMLERERENTDEWRKQAQQLALSPPKKNDLEIDDLNKSFWRRLLGR